MFRVRRGFFSGSPILQVSTLGKWRDAEVLPDLEKGFVIVSDAWMTQNDEILNALGLRAASLRAELDAIKAARSLAAKAGWAKKKAPVLTEQIVAEFKAQNANRGPYPRSPQKEAP